MKRLPSRVTNLDHFFCETFQLWARLCQAEESIYQSQEPNSYLWFRDWLAELPTGVSILSFLIST